jgi:predicted RNase H-like nuclease (RuvC/YqgF family)
MAEQFTIPEAAERLKITVKAVEKRIERGTIQSLKRDGRRVIPGGEIARVLAQPEAAHHQQASEVSPSGDESPRGEIAETLSQTLARLEVLAAENGRLRALQEVSESTEQRLSDELHRTRAELLSLQLQVAEQTPRRFWRRQKSLKA